jgi:hypothetical protein
LVAIGSVSRAISIVENENQTQGGFSAQFSLTPEERIASELPVHHVPEKAPLQTNLFAFTALRTSESALSPLIVLSTHESSTFETSVGAQWSAVACG